MSTKTNSIVLIVMCTLFTSTAQIFYKLGADRLTPSFYAIITNYYLIIGFLLYGVGAVLLILALKNGELSILYPIISTSYVWVAIVSAYLFGETLNTLKILGIITIIGGITVLNLGKK